tara:strand:- start:715 stop:1116 length:402 start_codon:yes stop_codon:yes gene_type:complete
MYLKNISKKFLGLATLFMTGCFSTPKMDTSLAIPTSFEQVHGLENLSVLSAIGGLCLVAGMALLVISRGTMGWRPVIGGIILITVNYLIAMYADWLFIPVLVVTGAISLAWGWRTVRDIIRGKKDGIFKRRTK